MFKFKDLSDDDEFKSEDYQISPKEFFEKRRKSKRPYVFDLRNTEKFEEGNIPGSQNIPISNTKIGCLKANKQLGKGKSPFPRIIEK